MDLFSLEALAWLAVLCVILFAVTTLIRRSVEKKWVALAQQKDGWWDDIVLPALPLLLGASFGYFVSSYPFPDAWKGTDSRIILGLFAGIVCERVVKVLKKLVGMKTETDQESSTDLDLTTDSTPPSHDDLP